MKKTFLVLLAAAAVAVVARLGIAQTVPRAPVKPVSGGSAPTPLPDPSGVYSGSVTLNLSGFAPVTQTWRADVQAQTCPDCDPGVYWANATSFSAIRYNDGTVERGGIRGVIGASGASQGLEFFVANCPFVQADGTYNIRGYLGGNFGSVSGTKLTIRNGVLSGSITGTSCYGISFTATVSMSKVPGTVLSCVPGIQSSQYNFSFANSCGGSGSGSVYVVRSGCIASFDIPGLAAVEATMTGSSTFNALIYDVAGCGGNTYSGTGTIGPTGTIAGTYSGTSSGGVGCCPAGSFSGSFSLAPK